jgi:hypothetical protein
MADDARQQQELARYAQASEQRLVEWALQLDEADRGILHELLTSLGEKLMNESDPAGGVNHTAGRALLSQSKIPGLLEYVQDGLRTPANKEAVEAQLEDAEHYRVYKQILERQQGKEALRSILDHFKSTLSGSQRASDARAAQRQAPLCVSLMDARTSEAAWSAARRTRRARRPACGGGGGGASLPKNKTKKSYAPLCAFFFSSHSLSLSARSSKKGASAHRRRGA